MDLENLAIENLFFLFEISISVFGTTVVGGFLRNVRLWMA
jgi:hypothetical protein